MRFTSYSATFLIVVLLHAGVAKGGLLASDSAAYNDGATTWRGTQPFTSLGLLDVNVDYAVYAPGQFQLSSALHNPTDPSGGAQYVYAYQLLNDVGGTLPVTAFSVGFTDAGDSDAGTEGANKQVSNVSFVSPFPVGAAPSNTTYNGQSAVWNYATALTTGSESAVLIYTSPYAPETDFASVQGFASDQERLPSPVPEPAGFLLIAFSGACVLAVRSRYRLGSTISRLRTK